MSDVPVFGERRPGVVYRDRPGAYALIRREGLIAAVRTSYGLFLPGGGLDPGESHREGLARELREEIDFVLERATYLGTAEQYNWSQHYRAHFRKIGYFYAVEAKAAEVPSATPEHELVWLTLAEGRGALIQEFHKFALGL